MLNLLSGVSPEIRVIMLFGFIGLMLLIAGSVLFIGLRRQAIENSGRFDIPVRSKKPDKPAKVKREKPVKVKKEKPAKVKRDKEPKAPKVKAEKPAKAAKPAKVKEQKAAKSDKPKKAGLFKKAPKPTGIALLAAPVGSPLLVERAVSEVKQPVEPAEHIQPALAPVEMNDSEDFDILPAIKSEPTLAVSSDDDFEFATYDQPVSPPTPKPASASGPFGTTAPAGDEEW